METIYLIGNPMGVGKTTVGHVLANKLENAIYLKGDLGWKDIPLSLTKRTKTCTKEYHKHD